ncbi:MAG: hypothetical protein V8R40_06750 [Dysosmobacter sp.]
MKYRHYRPQGAGDGNHRRAGEVRPGDLRRVSPGAGVICFDEFAHLFTGRRCTPWAPAATNWHRPSGCSMPCAPLTTAACRRSTPSARITGGWAWRWATG